MAVLSLPLYFSNSFWTQDYRKGLEVLYTKLEQVRVPAHVFLFHNTHLADFSQGASENDEITAFIRVRLTVIPIPGQLTVSSSGPSASRGEGWCHSVNYPHCHC